MADDDEWEESLLVMDLDGVIDSDWIKKSGDKWKIIGVETETPLLQMNRYVFTGKYEDTVGTDILFEVSDNTGATGTGETERTFSDIPSESCPMKQKLSYSYHVHKRLHMKRTFLNDKEEAKQPAATTSTLESETVHGTDTGPPSTQKEGATDSDVNSKEKHSISQSQESGKDKSYPGESYGITEGLETGLSHPTMDTEPQTKEPP